MGVAWKASAAFADLPANAPDVALPCTASAAPTPVVVIARVVFVPLFQLIVAEPLVVLLVHPPVPLPDAVTVPDFRVESVPLQLSGRRGLHGGSKAPLPTSAAPRRTGPTWQHAPMAENAWSVAAPGGVHPLDRLPPVDGDHPLDLRGAAVQARRISGVELPASSEIVDLVLSDCDVSAVVAQRSRLERAEVTRCRFRAVTWAGGVLRDVVLDQVRAEDLSVRFSTLRRVVLRGCDLPGLDLTEASLERVRFERCTLRGARFDHATMSQVTLTGCDLAGASGATSLAGASMDLDDVLTLAPSLARELGITVV